MLNKEIPFLRIGLPLCAGIISGLYIKPDFFFLLIISILCISGFIISLFFNKYLTNLLFGITFNLSLFFCGLLLYQNEKNSLSILKPEQTFFQCTLSDYPEEKENSYLLTVKLNAKISTAGTEAVRGSMVLYNKKDSTLISFLPGDILVIKCNPVEITNRGNPYEFDYRFYMENHGIKYYAFTSGSNIISHQAPSARKLIHKALIIREKIIEMYKLRGVSEERLPLVSAIILGQKNKIDQEQKQNFIRAGVMHIMAVSGLHAVILSLFVFNVLFFLKGRFNIIRILVTVLILWAFAYVTGLTPSVLRATLMFTFLQAGNLMHRKVNGINSVLASAFVLILIRPSVIFDAGFLLSYSAVIYIICFYQELYLKVQFKNWMTDKIWQSAVVTIVAQAGTLPLTIMLFNRFPTYFIITNIIIVPLSSLLVVLGCLIPLIFHIQFLSTFLAMILDNLTGLTELLTARAASLPGSNIENIGMRSIECFLLAITIFLFINFLLKKQRRSAFTLYLIIIAFVISVTAKEIYVRTTNELIIYNTAGSSTIGIKTGKILNIYSDTCLIRPEVLKHCATLGLKLKNNILSNKGYCIKAGEKKILICSELSQSIINNYMPDILILTGLKPGIDKNLILGPPLQTIILSSEVSSGYRIPEFISAREIYTVHLVRKSGAYIKRI